MPGSTNILPWLCHTKTKALPQSVHEKGGRGEKRPRQAPKTKDRQKLITVVIHICNGTSNVAGNGSEGRQEKTKKKMKKKEKRRRGRGIRSRQK